jgi:hypothetical protein
LGHRIERSVGAIAIFHEPFLEPFTSIAFHSQVHVIKCFFSVYSRRIQTAFIFRVQYLRERYGRESWESWRSITASFWKINKNMLFSRTIMRGRAADEAVEEAGGGTMVTQRARVLSIHALRRSTGCSGRMEFMNRDFNAAIRLR